MEWQLAQPGIDVNMVCNGCVGQLIDCDLRESFEKKIYLSSTFGAINKNFPRFEGEIREN